MKSFEEQGDLRVRRTHKLLWEALMAELSVRPFEEITVTDICERAMVHRTTFYKHYEDKYALLEQGMRQMYEALLAEGHKPPGEFSAHDPPRYFVQLFEHVAHYQHFYKVMVCGDGIGRFQRLLKEYLVEVISARVQGGTPANQPLAFPLAMQAHGFAGAVLSLLTWWLENDMPLTPHQMAHYLLTLHATWSQHS